VTVFWDAVANPPVHSETLSRFTTKSASGATSSSYPRTPDGSVTSDQSKVTSTVGAVLVGAAKTAPLAGVSRVGAAAVVSAGLSGWSVSFETTASPTIRQGASGSMF